jgi:hypothetical protein
MVFTLQIGNNFFLNLNSVHEPSQTFYRRHLKKIPCEITLAINAAKKGLTGPEAEAMKGLFHLK